MMPKQPEGEEAIKGSFLQNEQKTSFKNFHFRGFSLRVAQALLQMTGINDF
jgi:hypothetical protein